MPWAESSVRFASAFAVEQQQIWLMEHKEAGECCWVGSQAASAGQQLRLLGP
jgi:hypothetical protein